MPKGKNEMILPDDKKKTVSNVIENVEIFGLDISLGPRVCL